MIRDLGLVQPGTTLYIPFHTFDSNDPSASVTLTGLATTDIEIYKDGSVTQRASDSGYALLDTDGIDFDATTGIHGISINLADNTTAGFYAAGSQYWVVIASVTVDAATVNFILCTFRIGYEGARLNTTIATLSSQTSFTLTVGPAEDDALNGFYCLIHDVASAVQVGHAIISDYTGSTKTVTLAAGTTFTAAATDNIAVMGPMPMQPTVAARTLDVSAGGEAGVDWANVGTPGSTVSLSATTVATVTTTTTATNVTTVNGLAANVITASSIAADAIGASELAADAVAEIADAVWDEDATAHQTQGTFGQAIGDPAADTGTIFKATVTDATGVTVGTDTATILTRLGTPSDLGGGATVAANLSDIEGQTDDIGAAGAGLTAVPWNAAWDAEVQSEVTDGLNAYDPPTRAEATADKNEVLDYLAGLVLAKGTIGATGNDTTHIHLDGLAYADDGINSLLLVLKDVSTGLFYARWVEDFANTGDLATVATLPVTPEASVDLYWLLPIRADVTGGSGLDAAGVRAAVGLASANLDTQLGTIDSNVDAILVDTGTTLQGELDGIQADTEDIQSRLPAALTADGNIKADTLRIGGTLQTANDVGGDVNEILTDTAEIGVAGAGLTNINLPDQTMNVTGNITGNLSGSVGSVTGAVGSVAGNVDGNVTGTIGGLTAAALKDFFDTDSTTTYGAAVAGSVVKEIADNAGGSALTEAGIADAVWDEAQAGHVAAGSFGELATESAAIKAKTDSLTFTVANQVDVNVEYVNGIQVTGTGQSGDEWGPV